MMPSLAHAPAQNLLVMRGHLLKIGMLAAFASLACFAPDVLAQNAPGMESISGGKTLGEMSKNTADSFNGVIVAIRIFMYVLAFAFAALAVLKFRAHSENPRETGLKVPIILVICAVLAATVPMLLSSGSKTLYGTDTIAAPPSF